jgi:hypothetical protein
MHPAGPLALPLRHEAWPCGHALLLPPLLLIVVRLLPPPLPLLVQLLQLLRTLLHLRHPL